MSCHITHIVINALIMKVNIMFVCEHRALLHPCLSDTPAATSAMLPPLNVVALQKPIHKAYNCRHLVCDYGSLGVVVVVVLGVGALVEMNVRRSV